MHELARRGFIAGSFGLSLAPFAQAAKPASPMHGANLIETEKAPFGSPAAAASLRALAGIGADCVALVPFLWQARPDSPDLLYGDAVPLSRLRLGIAQARHAGLRTIIKPHVWIPGHWAGQVAMRDTADWKRWFAAYVTQLDLLAALAHAEAVDALIVGTELAQTSRQPAWADVIARVRARYGGTISYVAHGPEEAETVPFWSALDALSVSLYPPLGGARDPSAWRAAMSASLQRAQAVANIAEKPLWVAEFGLRSARGATRRPWESAEEREALPDGPLQAAVIEAWLQEAARCDVRAMLVWRWFSDPQGGGAADTDFTVQNKPAEALLRRYWLRT